MAKYRALICGAGRIGAGYGDWADPAYTHAGAYRALADRVELMGFVEPSEERAEAARRKWGVNCWSTIGRVQDWPDIISVCTAPQEHATVFRTFPGWEKAVWCEKPYMGPLPPHVPTQVNFLRRADPEHRRIASLVEQDKGQVSVLEVTAKNDIHTWPHFSDLAKWWKADTVVYHPIADGPCSYAIDWFDPDDGDEHKVFPNGGINPAECMKGMLSNLLDAIEGKAELWSPPY